jgi:hypothetical protein
LPQPCVTAQKKNGIRTGGPIVWGEVLVPHSRKDHESCSSETWTFRHRSNLCNLRYLRIELTLFLLSPHLVCRYTMQEEGEAACPEMMPNGSVISANSA